MRHLRFAFALGIVLVASTAAGQRLPRDRGSPIDARVRLLYEHRRTAGSTLPMFRRDEAFEQSGLAPLLVHWRREPTAKERSAWKALGFEEIRRLRSGAVKIRASEAALVAIHASGALARASVDLAPPWLVRPLDRAATEIGLLAAAAAYRRAHDGVPLDGTGVVVGDIDGTVDYYHPAFFKPLAPVAWVDVDGDGALTPGVDGVDVDRNGAIEPHEILKLLPARGSSLFGHEGDLYGTDDPAFNPGWDYLWLDWNGDGRRNVGDDVAGAETLPSLGEPVYAADDVDRDGALRVPERVVPLGESKLRAIRRGSNVCLRGQNLTDCKVTAGGDDGGHATLMLGAVAGGQAGISRFAGMAPEAEIVLSTYGLSPLTDDLEFVLEQGADVVLTELGDFGTGPSDGTTELELALDAAVAQQGVVAVSPAGNLGLSRKHAFATLPAATAPEPYQNGLVLEQSVNTIAISVTWREGDTDATGTITTADGDTIDLSTDATNQKSPNGRTFNVAHGTTPKGAGYLLVFVSGASLPPQGNFLMLKSAGTKPLTASLYATDAVSGWRGGLNFADGDVDGCMNAPAFAANTIAVSAYALHTGKGYTPYPEAAGELRGYSGRGPDLWGDRGIDLAAPDNGVAAAAETLENGLPNGLAIDWMESGGTSGSGAVTAGVAALVVQANPGLPGLELRQKVLDACRVDAAVEKGTPEMWGEGKLGVGPGAPGAPPEVGLTFVAPGGAARLTAEITDDGDVGAAKARWDFGYDGTWDVDWQPGLTAETTIPEGAAFLDVKVEVMDADGWMVPAVVRITPTEPEPVRPTQSRSGEDDGGCGCRLAGAPARDGSAGPAVLGWAVLACAAALGAARRRP